MCLFVPEYGPVSFSVTPFRACHLYSCLSVLVLEVPLSPQPLDLSGCSLSVPGSGPHVWLALEQFVGRGAPDCCNVEQAFPTHALTGSLPPQPTACQHHTST